MIRQATAVMVILNEHYLDKLSSVEREWFSGDANENALRQRFPMIPRIDSGEV